MRLPVRLDLIKCLLQFCDICLQFIQYYPWKVFLMLLQTKCSIQHFLQSATCLGVTRNSVLCVFSLSCLSACWPCHSQTFLISSHCSLSSMVIAIHHVMMYIMHIMCSFHINVLYLKDSAFKYNEMCQHVRLQNLLLKKKYSLYYSEMIHLSTEFRVI